MSVSEELHGSEETASAKETDPMRQYALVSVYDKTGIGEVAEALTDVGYGIISTGGTARALADTGISVIPITEITGNPEAFGGRMKSISFQVESGLLYDRDNPEHAAQARDLGIPNIGVVVCNLYPFAETVSRPDVTLPDAIEQIDVGGPTMIRAAAKNFRHVLVVVDPADYPRVAESLRRGDRDSGLRQELAAKAFRHLAYYDSQIARYLGKELYPSELSLPLRIKGMLRYGDNPDQTGAFYGVPGSEAPLTKLTLLSGREPSATNITDMDAGIKAVELFGEPAAVVIKHNTPCGIATGETTAEALLRALDADPESAFGGVVVLNRPMTADAAQAIAAFKEAGRGQMDIIAAPDIESDALDILRRVRKTTGVYSVGPLGKSRHDPAIRMVDGGAVIQTPNDPGSSFAGWETVTEVHPTDLQLELMRSGWKFIARMRSNTVAVIDGALPMTRGIGTGQTSRILATQIALERAGIHTRGAILAGDSFFPFDDSVKLAARAGIAAVVQQGGSIRDADSIRAANEAGIAMVFTHQRVFWH